LGAVDAYFVGNRLPRCSDSQAEILERNFSMALAVFSLATFLFAGEEPIVGQNETGVPRWQVWEVVRGVRGLRRPEGLLR